MFYLMEKNAFGWRLVSSELVRGLPVVVTVSGFLRLPVVGADDLPEILPGFSVGSWSVVTISAAADGLRVRVRLVLILPGCNLLFRQKYKLQNVDKWLYYAICIGVYLHLISNY